MISFRYFILEEMIPNGVLIFSFFFILISDLLQNPLNKSRIFQRKFFRNRRLLIFIDASAELFYLQAIILWNFYRLYFFLPLSRTNRIA